MGTSLKVIIVVVSLISLCACGSPQLAAGPDFEKNFQKALIQAKPGAVIEVPAGHHSISGTLSLSVPKVTIRGKGMSQTVLSFKNQKTGSAGMTVTAGDFTIEDLAFEDTKGDALKITGAENVTIRRVRSEWTGGPLETNGAYGLYPVQCKNVLIEDSVVIGAADAGIYVGQSSQIIVRRNRVQSNVAGIEIENSTAADVHDNRATKNTGGILVFNLPDLPVKDGRQVRVFANQVIENNLPNFAPKGNLVAKVPAGTGVMVMAASQVDIYNNVIQNNATSNVSVISYLVTGNPIKDKNYYPYTESIYVHGNTISGGGVKPDGQLAKTFMAATKKQMADIVYDGIINAEKATAAGMPAELRVCVDGNGAATFINLDAGRGFKGASSDAKKVNCKLPELPAVQLPSL